MLTGGRHLFFTVPAGHVDGPVSLKQWTTATLVNADERVWMASYLIFIGGIVGFGRPLVLF